MPKAPALLPARRTRPQNIQWPSSKSIDAARPCRNDVTTINMGQLASNVRHPACHRRVQPQLCNHCQYGWHTSSDVFDWWKHLPSLGAVSAIMVGAGGRYCHLKHNAAVLLAGGSRVGHLHCTRRPSQHAPPPSPELDIPVGALHTAALCVSSPQ